MNNIVTLNRYEWADIAKGIGIFLMVMGHSGLPLSVHDWIYSFHMPFFFILSGYFFRSGKYKTGEFITRKLRAIMVPYVFFIITIELLRLAGNGIGLKMPPPRSIEEVVLYGRDLGATWFLISLFLTELLYYLFDRLFKNKRWLLILTMVTFCASYYCYMKEMHFPYKLEILGATLMYYSIGNILAQTKYKKVFTENFVKGAGFLIVLVVLLVLDFVLANKIDPVLNLRLNRLGIHVLTLMLIAFGTILIIQSSHFIGDCTLKPFELLKRFLKYIGEYSIVLIGFSQITLQCLKSVMEMFNLPSIIAVTVRYTMLWVILMALIYVFKNYLPSLIGKQNR